MGPGGDLQQAGLVLNIERDLCGLARWTKGQPELGPVRGPRGPVQVVPSPLCGQIFLGLSEDE